jgi:hypothetical protein
MTTEGATQATIAEEVKVVVPRRSELDRSTLPPTKGMGRGMEAALERADTGCDLPRP